MFKSCVGCDYIVVMILVHHPPLPMIMINGMQMHPSTPLKLRLHTTKTMNYFPPFPPSQCRRDSWQVYIHEPSTWLENGSLLLCWAVVLARLLIVFSSTYQNWSFNPNATNQQARTSFRDLENLSSATPTFFGTYTLSTRWWGSASHRVPPPL